MIQNKVKLKIEKYLKHIQLKKKGVFINLPY